MQLNNFCLINFMVKGRGCSKLSIITPYLHARRPRHVTANYATKEVGRAEIPIAPHLLGRIAIKSDLVALYTYLNNTCC